MCDQNAKHDKQMVCNDESSNSEQLEQLSAEIDENYNRIAQLNVELDELDDEDDDKIPNECLSQTDEPNDEYEDECSKPEKAGKRKGPICGDELGELQSKLAKNEFKMAMIERELKQLDIDDKNDQSPRPPKDNQCDIDLALEPSTKPKPNNKEMDELEANIAANEDLLRMIDAELDNLNQKDGCCKG